MAIKTRGKHLNKEQMNSQDIDDDGEIDVERYPIKEKINSGNKYFDKVWRKAAQLFNGTSKKK